MAYKRKTRDCYDLQANYGFGDGYETIDSSYNRREMVESRKNYRANGDNAPMRIKVTRERIASNVATNV